MGPRTVGAAARRACSSHSGKPTTTEMAFTTPTEMRLRAPVVRLRASAASSAPPVLAAGALEAMEEFCCLHFFPDVVPCATCPYGYATTNKEGPTEETRERMRRKWRRVALRGAATPSAPSSLSPAELDAAAILQLNVDELASAATTTTKTDDDEPPPVAQLIAKAFRAQAVKTHPDAGGSTEDFVRLRAAFETLMRRFVVVLVKDSEQ